jgi:Flp pilus assembly protein TadD
MKVCPFISHMHGNEHSEILTIESAEHNKKTRRGATGGAGDVMILGYAEDGTAAPSAMTATIAVTDAGDGSLPACLKDPCRFYDQGADCCAFESMLSAMQTMAARNGDAAGTEDAASPKVMRELAKLWKFETKSVTELISHMSELDTQRQKELQSFRDDLDARMENAATMIGEITRVLEQSMETLQTQGADLMKKMEELSSSVPSDVTGRLDGIEEQQRAWDAHMKAFAANHAELLDFFRADKNRRDVEWMRSNKKEARTLNNLGVTSFHNGAFDTARVQFMKAIELDPECAEVYNNLGLVCTEIGEEEKACEAFTKATQLNPDMAAAYGNLGYLHHKQGRYEEAVAMKRWEETRRAVRHTPIWGTPISSWGRIRRRSAPGRRPLKSTRPTRRRIST